jgi:rod shape-determining protein MreD
MRRRAALAGFAIAVVLFQLALGHELRVRAAVPELPWILVLYAAVYGRRAEALVTALASGFALDLLSLDPAGSHSLPLLVVALLLARAADRRWTESPVVLAILLGAGLACLLLLRAGVVWVVEGAAPWWAVELQVLAATIVYTWPAFSVLHRVSGRLLEPARDIEIGVDRWYAGA